VVLTTIHVFGMSCCVHWHRVTDVVEKHSASTFHQHNVIQLTTNTV